MRTAYVIFTGYALLGFIYAPGLYSLTALAFIAASCAPLLLVGSQADGRVTQLEPVSKGVYWSIVALGFLNVAIIVRGLDMSITQLLSVDGIVEAAATATVRRYRDGGGSGNPLILSLSLWLLFRIGACVDKASKILLVVAAAPLVLYTAVSTEKWPLFLGVVFFLTGVLVGYPRRKSLALAARYFVLLLPFSLVAGGVAMVLRGSIFFAPAIIADLMHYVFAPYAAFGTWLVHRSQGLCCTLGVLTAVGPLDAMGVVERAPGVFADRLIVHGQETNIFTAFRYMVQDFSLLGPFLIASLLAAFHIGLTRVGSPALARAVTGFTLFAAMMSLTVTPFVHNSAGLAVLLSLLSTVVAATRFASPRLVDHPSGAVSPRAL